MVRNYDLTKNPFDTNRIRKASKQALANFEEDRLQALEIFKYFKEKVESDEDVEEIDKKCLLEAQKTVQTASNNTVKVLRDLAKLDIDERKLANTGKDKDNTRESFPSFDDLRRN